MSTACYCPCLSCLPLDKDCPSCGEKLAIVPTPEQKTHWAKYECQNNACARYLKNAGWVSKPKDGDSGRKANRRLLKKIPDSRKAFCEFCMRSSEVLDGLKPALQLEVHHVIEVKDGGTDEPSNLRVYCAECHALSHRQREAFSRYLKSQPHPQQTEQHQQSLQKSPRIEASSAELNLLDQFEFLSPS